MSVNQRMEEETTVYPLKGILLSNKNKGTTDTCINTDEL